MNFGYYKLKNKKFQFKENAPIPVIASFDGLGNIKPLYFQYVFGEDTVRIKIEKVLSRKPFLSYGIHFLCDIAVSDTENGMVVLFYHIPENIWYLRESMR